ncbi:class I SAM-dependent methyltransferase [Anaerotalea alkaliphila]|uniref:S-adenosyl-L-methionine-dependent methyltransferase n=1 Tax=Anaerotalea alkaliphila TaxID=2662126 RepID=A0A7X5KMC4_9FIRM|nr:SAM-dependent methyltransferase [Anaerotalea alkaliphila]NDL66809.1 SAM-dependent methyltransferase [Anaerotalea alkaliphila]
MKHTLMAAGTAFLKAVEAMYEKEERIFDDRYSVLLLPPSFRFLIKLMESKRVLRYMVGVRERSTPGVLGGILCRNRYIDDVLDDAIRDGFKTVVNLGAGYDTRALRVQGIQDLKVYEIDAREVIDEKRRRMRQAGIKFPSNLRFVPIDFDRQNLREELEKARCDPSDKTLFIMEGVTQYIAREAFEDTLRFVGAAAPGSRLVFTYVLQDLFDHPERHPENRLMMRQFMTGFSQTGMEAYLSGFGLGLKEDVGAEVFRERYLKPKNRDLGLMEIERVAVAEVVS